MVTLELLQKLAPKTNRDKLAALVGPLNAVMEKYSIDTRERAAAFLAQCGHESGGFNAIKENLNYSADGLRKVFPKYFPTAELAEQYARQPQKIASRIYGGRMGNGDESTHEGYTYCGRGLIQLTGKNNYTAMATEFGMTLEQVVVYLETQDGACMSAGWFWNKNKLNQFADSGDFTTLTKRINGGTIGLEDRKHHYDVALAAL
jgi:putative chitinase